MLVTDKKQIIYDPNLFKVNIDSFFSCQWNTLTALFFSWIFLALLDVLTTIIPLHRILIATEYSAQEPWSGVSQVNFGTSWKLGQQRVWVSLSSSICHLKHWMFAWLAKICSFRYLSWYFSLMLHKSTSAHFYLKLKIRTLCLLFY